MAHPRRSETGYDYGAPKRRVNITLNEDLVRVAQSYTDNLSGTIEQLLATWAREEGRKRDDDREHHRKVAAAWNDFDAKHGRFAEEWTQDFLPERDTP